MALKKNINDLKDTIENKIDSMELANKPSKTIVLDISEDSEDDVLTMRISKNNKAILKKHFKSMGLSLSSGVRMVVYKYIEKGL